MSENKNKKKGVEVGDKVRVKINGGDAKEFTIVPTQRANPVAGLISDLSPLGEALMDSFVGEKRSYRVGERTFEAEVLEITKDVA